jgi:hypothetical protein
VPAALAACILFGQQFDDDLAALLCPGAATVLPDFAVFDVDITTINPTVWTLLHRVMISGDGAW